MKVMKPLMALLRSWAVRMITYINDMLILAQTKETTQHLEVLLFLLEALGFMINSEKSHMNPAQEIEFLGLTIDSLSLQLRLPGEKIRQIGKEVFSVPGQTQCSLSGNVDCSLVLSGPAEGSSENLNKQSSGLRVSSGVLKRVSTWWQTHLTQWNRRTVIQRPAQILIQSDASLAGWGAVCNGVSTGGSWSLKEQMMHINCLELLAADLAVRTFLKYRQGVSALLQLDNSMAVAYINNLGGTVLPLSFH